MSDRPRISALGLATVLVALLFMGCSSQLTVQPPLPTEPVVSPSQSRVGVYMKPTPTGSLDLGSGVWPKTAYQFSPHESLFSDLVALTKRHFPNSSVANSTVDKRFDYVIEFVCNGAAVETNSLATKIPLTITMRNPVSFQDVYTETVVGQGGAQSGRFLDLAFGRVTERRALEKSLNEATTDLYRKTNASLAKMAINESEIEMTRPYKRNESKSVSPMRRSRRGG
ncbi:MAG: hypothetical protein H6751_08745 [Candidatus Omnitrophica bacterium]|nr:hypothetical protein [Candidatus Omnitrophota bacterium]